MYNLLVENCTEQEAHEMGRELSMDVIYDWPAISSQLVEDSEVFQENEDELDIFHEDVEQFVLDDIAYEIYEIEDAKGLMPFELESEAYRIGAEFFIEEFCK